MEAESAAITGPPALLEQVVLFLLPPAARETVGGDLCEIYCSPLQYASQAIRTLPFVIASQLRRNANFPLLLVQGAILAICFGGFFSVSAHGPLVWPKAGLCAAVALFGLSLYEAYQRPERPTSRHAMVETILVSLGILLLFPQLLLGTLLLLPAHIAWWPGLALLGCFLVIVPVLCLLRTGLILSGDQEGAPGEISSENIAREFHHFQRRQAWRNQIEAVALGVAAIFCAVAGRKTGLFNPDASLITVTAYGAAALYLSLQNAGHDISAAADLRSLRARYQQELAQRLQLRRFLWWLWCTPLFLAAYTDFIVRGVADRQPSLVTLGIVVTLLLGFFIGAFNRERGGHFREKIALLNGAREYAL